jgi:Tfp pilus assembly protein PilP
VFRQVHLVLFVTAAIAASSSAWTQGVLAVPRATKLAQPPVGGTPALDANTYDPEGRRDPFVSLLRGAEAPPGGKTTGLSGMATADLVVRGILQSRGAYIAIVAGPDAKTYRARVNDRLLDGVIRSVTSKAIIIMQEVNDPLSLVKQREVRKGLRIAEDGK